MERDKVLFKYKLVDNREPRESLLHDFIDSSDDLFKVMDCTDDIHFTSDTTLLSACAVNMYLNVDVPEELVVSSEEHMTDTEDTIIKDPYIDYLDYVATQSGYVVDADDLIDYIGSISELDSYVYSANSVSLITENIIDRTIYDRILYFTTAIAYVDYVDSEGGYIEDKRTIVDYLKEIV